MNKKIFTVLFFSMFSAILGVGIVVPLLPVYAHDLGASGIYIALIFGSFSLSRAIFLPYFGKLSDTRGRKPFIMSGLFVYALISCGFIFANDIHSLIGVRFLQGIGSAMVLPVAQAYIGEITPAGKEGFVMGLFNLSLYGALSLGPVAGGMIKEMMSIQASFVSMGVFAIIGFLLCVFLLPPTKLEHHTSFRQKPPSYRHLLNDRVITALFVFRMAYTICIGIVWAFLPILADSEFDISSFHIGILVMSGVLIAGILQTPMGMLADRMNKRLLVISGGLITTCAIFSLEYAVGFKSMLLSNIIYGLGGGIAMPAIMAVSVIKGNKTNSMGAIMALLTLGHTIGMFFGSLLAGIIMDMFNLHMIFITGSVLMLLGVGIFFVCTNRKEIG